jgi:hypothetical protein
MRRAGAILMLKPSYRPKFLHYYREASWTSHFSRPTGAVRSLLMGSMECPRTFYMDLNGLLCKVIRGTSLHSRQLKVTIYSTVPFTRGASAWRLTSDHRRRTLLR